MRVSFFTQVNNWTWQKCKIAQTYFIKLSESAFPAPAAAPQETKICVMVLSHVMVLTHAIVTVLACVVVLTSEQ